MSQPTNISLRTNYSVSQYAFYIFAGFCIWLLGVGIVRIVGESVFSTGNPLLIAFYVLSIPIGAVTMFALPLVCRLPMKDMLIPTLVMIFVTLSFDGLAVGFTNIYGATDELVRLAGGWLLWSFGMQLIVSMMFVIRAFRD